MMKILIVAHIGQCEQWEMIPSGPEHRHQVPLCAQTMYFAKGPTLTQTVVLLVSGLGLRVMVKFRVSKF